MKACPNGHGLIIDSNNFCWSCGSKLVDKVPDRCFCGHELQKADQYCTNCGTKRVIKKVVMTEPQKAG